MKTRVLIWLLFIQLFSYGQNNISIYEVGDSLINCETNFKNLFNNWTESNITNANAYKLLKYSFVETITDSIKFNYYRNYFSGDKPVNSSIKMKNGKDSSGKIIHEFYIKPGFVYKEFYDQRELPENIKKIFSKEFKHKAKEILIRNFNVDTFNLNYYFYEENKTDTIINIGNAFTSYSVAHTFTNSKGASSDSLSRNYIDIVIKGEKSIEDLNINEKRALILEKLLIDRINSQLFFNKQVQIGDKVYLVNFEYNGKFYTNYVICSSRKKKVVMDYFFKNIILNEK